MDAMGLHIGFLFEFRAKGQVVHALANDPRLTAEQVVAGQGLVTRDLIAQAAAKVDGGAAELASFAERSAGFSLANLWAAIVAFFESPLGQLILKALVTMILAMLGL